MRTLSLTIILGTAISACNIPAGPGPGPDPVPSPEPYEFPDPGWVESEGRHLPVVLPPMPTVLGSQPQDLPLEEALAIASTEASYNVDKEIREVYKYCLDKNRSLQDEMDRTKDNEKKKKTIVGAITGAIATIGGIIVAASDNNDVETVAGISTAVVGLAGTITITLVNPGEAKQATTRDMQKELVAYIQRIEKFLDDHPKPPTWPQEVQSEWSEEMGKAGSLCGKPI